MARCGSKSPDILCMLYSGNPEPSSELVEMLPDSLDDNPDHRGLRARAAAELDDGNIKKSLQNHRALPISAGEARYRHTPRLYAKAPSFMPPGAR